MRYKLIFTIFFLAFFSFSKAQLRKSIGLIEKEKYDQAIKILIKSIDKDSIDVAGHTGMALLHSNIDFPLHDFDSAHFYILQAQSNYLVLPEKSKEKLAKKALDSLFLVRTHQTIDSLEFTTIDGTKSIELLDTYIHQYKQSYRIPEAIAQRNQLAFEHAKAGKKASSMLDFIKKYPQAIQIPKANTIYDDLNYKEQTAPQTTQAYKKFVKSFPESRHVAKAKRQWYLMATALGVADKFRPFIHKDTKDKLSNLAISTLSYVHPDYFRKEFVDHPLYDSLNFVQNQLGLKLYPTIKNNRFNWIDNTGRLLSSKGYKKLDIQLFCDAVSTPLYTADDNLYCLGSDQIIYTGTPEKYEYLGAGWIFVQHKNKSFLTPLFDLNLQIPANSADLFQNSLIYATSHTSPSLTGINGFQIKQLHIEQAALYQNTFVLKRKKGWLLLSGKEIEQTINTNQYAFKNTFDSIENVQGQFLRTSGQPNKRLFFEQQYLDKDILDITLLEQKSLYLLHKPKQLLLVDAELQNIGNILSEKLVKNRTWVAGLQSDSSAFLYNLKLKQSKTIPADSVYTLGNQFLIVLHQQSTTIFGPNAHTKKFEFPIEVALIKQNNTLYSEFIKIVEKDHPHIYNANLSPIITHKWDKISPIGPDLLVVKRKGKYGIVDFNGDLVLKPIYDGIGNYADGNVTLLKKKKFGLFNVQSKLLIQPAFKQGLKAYGDNYFIAVKDTQYGLIDKKGVPVTAFSYDAILPWNNEMALVKQSFHFQLIDIANSEEKIDLIKDYQNIGRSGSQEHVLVLRDNFYGLVNKAGEWVLEDSYDHIENVGSYENPIYFTEKYIEEAEYHILLYYDGSGKLIHKSVVEGDIIDEIYCDQ